MKKIWGEKYSILMAAVVCLLTASVGCGAEKESAADLLRQAGDAANAGRWDRTLIAADKVLDQEKQNTDALVLSALALEQSGQPEEALARMSRAANTDEQHFAAQYSLGRMLYRKGKYEQCLSPLKTALALRRNDVNTLLLLAKASAKLNTRDSLNYYKALLSLPKFKMDPVLLNEIGVILVMRKQSKKALPLFVAATQKAPDNAGITLNCAIVYDYHLHDRIKAGQYYNLYLRQTANRQELDGERFAVTQRLQTIR